jgi:hypothetical protein
MEAKFSTGTLLEIFNEFHFRKVEVCKRKANAEMRMSAYSKNGKQTTVKGNPRTSLQV